LELSLPDEWEVNPTLLQVLRSDFTVDISAGELLELLDEGGAGAPDASRLFERLAKAAWSVPGLAVSPRVGLGNFSYAKWEMVQHIEGGLDALVASDLLCAIAGYAPAGQAIRDRQVSAEISEPDRVAPTDEFLVLDVKVLTEAASIGVAHVAGVHRTLVRRRADQIAGQAVASRAGAAVGLPPRWVRPTGTAAHALRSRRPHFARCHVGGGPLPPAPEATTKA